MPRASFQNLLIAVELSFASFPALERLHVLPLADGARVSLLHVLPRGEEREALDAAQERLHQLAARTRDELAAPALKMTALVVRGRPAECILEQARRQEAELIVLGRSNPHGAEKLLGSTADHVLREADRPVLLAHAPGRPSYQTPVVALEPSAGSGEELRLVSRVASPTAPYIHVIHVYDTSYALVQHAAASSTEDELRYRSECHHEATRLVEERLRELGEPRVPWRLHITGGIPRDVILADARRWEADLLVLGNRHRPRLGSMLVRSVTEGVAHAAWCDVLVATPRKG